MNYVLNIAGIVLVWIAAISVLCLLMAWPFMVLWNTGVAPTISWAAPVTFWPAFCILLFFALFVYGARGQSK